MVISKKKKEKRKKQKNQDQQKAQRKMLEINPNLSITTILVEDRNVSLKENTKSYFESRLDFLKILLPLFITDTLNYMATK